VKVNPIFGEKPGAIILGHRGCPKEEKENTMLSFTAAIMHGADGIETDVHMTKDGELVLIHDFNLMRIAGKDIPVEGSTYSELMQAFPEIPTLDMLFDAFSDRILYDLELKSNSLSGERLAKAVYGKIKERGLGRNVMASSFNPFIMRAFQRLAKDEIPLAPIFEIMDEVPRMFQKGLGRRFFRSMFLKPGIKVYRQMKGEWNLPLSVWCVDDEKDAKELIGDGVRMIISNDVGRIIQGLS